MNLANKLTIFRMILVPIFVIVGYLGMKQIINGAFFGVATVFWLMDLIFIIASITDKLDGYIARSRNQVTTFGKFLDPLADKILVLSALIMLVEFYKIPAWVPIIVLTREFLVSGYRLIAADKGQVIAASFWGKLKIVTQMLAIIMIIVDRFPFMAFLFNPDKDFFYAYNVVSSVLLIISVIATIFSGWDYLKNGKELFKEGTNE